MKRLFRHIICCLVVLTALQACSSHDGAEPAEVGTTQLKMYVYLPERPAGTRAYEGDVASNRANEDALNLVQVWVFDNDVTTGTCITDGDATCYKELDGASLSGGVQEVVFNVTENFPSSHSTVKVYAIANAASLGLSLSASTTAAELDALTLTGNAFGTGTLTTAVTAEGLPLTAVAKDVAVQQSGKTYSIQPLTLRRAVSKLRFVVCRQPDTDGMFQLDRLTIGSGQISTSESLFNDSGNDWKISGGYTDDPIVLTATSVPALPNISIVPEYANPAEYAFTTQEAQAYNSLIDAGVRDGHLAETGPIYLRETDRALTGTIAYRIKKSDGTWLEKTANFTMDAAGDFARNRTWTVYAYFLGGRLYVQPTILPWTAAHDVYTYTTQGTTDMKYEAYLRYDIDKDASTWADTYVCVAYGFQNGSSGRPLYSPLITLTTQNSNELRLQLNNDKFRIIEQTVEQTDGVDHIIFTSHGQTLSLPGSGQPNTTMFYIVPTDNSNPADPYAQLVITEIHTDDGLPPTNIPFNHNLPGEEDHTTINIFNPGAAVYTENQENTKSGNGTQESEYWQEGGN